MIVAPTPRRTRLVTQSDHARLAADLLRLMRLPELIAHPRRALLLRAVSEHDNGWWEADAAPRLDAAGGMALDFRHFPPDLRQEIWRRGVERFSGDDPYLAALIATHALRLLPRVAQAPEEPSWAALRADLEGRRVELLAAAGETLATLALDDLWLEVADGLSLSACTGAAGFVRRPGWQVEVAEDFGAHTAETADEARAVELRLQPFPFAGVTSFALACRWLEPGRFASTAELARALAASAWSRLRIRVRPL